MQTPRPITHQHQGATRAEKIAREEQGQDEQPAVVHPNQDGRQILGRELRATQPVNHDCQRYAQQRNARRSAPGEAPYAGAARRRRYTDGRQISGLLAHWLLTPETAMTLLNSAPLRSLPWRERN